MLGIEPKNGIFRHFALLEPCIDRLFEGNGKGYGEHCAECRIPGKVGKDHEH